jgi:hypothetical protein
MLVSLTPPLPFIAKKRCDEVRLHAGGADVLLVGSSPHDRTNVDPTRWNIAVSAFVLSLYLSKYLTPVCVIENSVRASRVIRVVFLFLFVVRLAVPCSWWCALSAATP